MEERITILYLEDKSLDVELIRSTLTEGGLSFNLIEVAEKEDYIATLKNDYIDVILADYTLPSFNGISALRIAKQFCDDVPFIFVSGTLEEKVAVDTLKEGATDYVIKDRLYRLLPSIIRAIQERKDLQERKKAEEELRESEKNYRLLANNASDVIWVTDLNLNLTYVSPSVERMRGYTQEEVMALPVKKSFTPGSWKLLLSVFKEDLTKEDKGEIDLQQSRTVELMQYCKDGSTIWIEATTRFLRDENGKAAGVLGISRDITKRKEAEAEQERLYAQLQHAQKMEAIGTMAGGIAHDFNNILGSISLNAEMVYEDIVNHPEARYSTEQILKASQRAKRLIEQILTFSRDKKVEQKLIQIDIIVEETLKMLRSMIPTTISIQKEFSENLWAIFANPTHIQQLVMNLCTNASQAMENGGSLTVKLSNVDMDQSPPDSDLKPGSYVELIIKDSGHGITSENKKRIFDPFFSTKQAGDGTGLGLSVVHGIVLSNNGSITVDSKPDKGTSFEILFPKANGTGEAMETDMLTMKTGTEKLLFIDDEDSIVDAGQRMLERLGYDVTTQTDSIEALELFGRYPEDFDLVITDTTMPHMSGMELSSKLMEIRPDIPIIICTGYSHLLTFEKAKAIGIKDYVMKPFEKQVMANTIRNVLDSPR
jgi:PAS domain S-box-containing protein